VSDQKKDNDLDEVRAAYKGLNAMRGKCPSSEDLVRYQQRSLSTEEMLLIKQHLNLCGLCDWAVTELAEFDSVAIPSVQQEESLPKRTKSPLRFFLYPALGFALVLILLIPAFLFILQPKAALHQSPNIAGSARDFDLGVGSSTRSVSSAKKKLVVLSRSERFFILNFFIPIRTDHKYEMEILNQKEQKVDSGDIQSRDPLGNFSIVCSSNVFPDGDYSLTIKEIAQQTRQVKDEYRFLFQVERQQ
jgi:hypothetical protein